MNSRSSCSNVIVADFKVQFVEANVQKHKLSSNKVKTHLFLNSSPHLAMQTTPAAETQVLHIQTLRCMHPHSLHPYAGNPHKLHAVKVVFFSKTKAHLMSKVLLALKIQWRYRLNSVVLFKYLILKKAYKRERVTCFPAAKLNTNSFGKEPYVTSPRRNN